MLTLQFAHTIKSAQRAGIDLNDAPADATHVTGWSRDESDAPVLVFTKTVWRSLRVWDCGQWCNTEEHYVAARLLMERRCRAAAHSARVQHGPAPVT